MVNRPNYKYDSFYVNLPNSTLYQKYKDLFWESQLVATDDSIIHNRRYNLDGALNVKFIISRGFSENSFKNMNMAKNL